MVLDQEWDSLAVVVAVVVAVVAAAAAVAASASYASQGWGRGRAALDRLEVQGPEQLNTTEY